jgi:hypothetical protein
MPRKHSPLILILAALLLPPVAWGTAWKWVAYGDTRTNDDAHRSVLHAIKAHTPDYAFIINVGDVVEDGGVAGEWEVWQKACDEELGGTGQDRTPPGYLAVPGNHDHAAGRGASLWEKYLSGQAERYGHGGKYFTFDYANARFLVLDSEGTDGPEQAALLQAAAQDNPQTWLFAVWHKPIYDFGSKYYEADLSQSWGKPLYQGGCDLIFNGHAHNYVRTLKLGLDGTPHPPVDEAGGTVQLVTGNGGAPLYPVVRNTHGNGYMVAYPPEEKSAPFYGYTELAVDGAVCVLRHFRADGKLMDTATYHANPKPGKKAAPAEAAERPAAQP